MFGRQPHELGQVERLEILVVVAAKLERVVLGGMVSTQQTSQGLAVVHKHPVRIFFDPLAYFQVAGPYRVLGPVLAASEGPVYRLWGGNG